MSEFIQGASAVTFAGIAAHAVLAKRAGSRGPLHYLSIGLDHLRAEIALLSEYADSIRWIHQTQKDKALWKVRQR